MAEARQNTGKPPLAQRKESTSDGEDGASSAFDIFESAPFSFRIIEHKTVQKKSSFTLFTIEVTHGPFVWNIYRRYSDFVSLNDKLKDIDGHLTLPSLPPKKFFGRFDPVFLDERQAGLQSYLTELTKIEAVQKSEAIRWFIAIPRRSKLYVDGELDEDEEEISEEVEDGEIGMVPISTTAPPVAEAPAYFSESYIISQLRLLDAAQKSELDFFSLPLSDEVRGPGGEELSIDIVWIGEKKRPKRVLLHFCGTRGVEGLAGSAIQLKLAEDPPVLPPGVALLLVHGVNPYGMAMQRRVNDKNVDLNKNFLRPDDTYTGVPRAYESMLAYLDPSQANDNPSAGVSSRSTPARQRSGTEVYPVPLSPRSPERSSRKKRDSGNERGINDSGGSDGGRRYSIPSTPPKEDKAAPVLPAHEEEAFAAQQNSPKMPFLKRLFYYISMTTDDVRDAIAEGQYEHPHGLAYGGKAMEEPLRLLLKFLDETHVLEADRLAIIDVHTGHGDYKTVTHTCPLPEDSPAFVRTYRALRKTRSALPGVEGSLVAMTGETSFEKRGSLVDGLLARRKKKASFFYGVAQAFGTFPLVKIFDCMREVNAKVYKESLCGVLPTPTVSPSDMQPEDLLHVDVRTKLQKHLVPVQDARWCGFVLRKGLESVCRMLEVLVEFDNAVQQ